ncbi:MAG: MMPL family transporter [Planctomycetes bacterium]|nr:MMPL family transporter [Planctomycetota bacterium]
MQQYFQTILRRPGIVLSVLAASWALCALGLPRIRFDNNPDSFLPPHHEAYRIKKTVEEKFGLEDPMLLAVITGEPDGIYRPGPLKRIQELTGEIERILAGYPDLVPHPVYSLATEKDVELAGGILHETPFLEPFPETDEDLRRLKAAVSRLELYTGVIVSEDGSAGAIIIVPPRGRAEEVHARVARLLDERREPDLELLLAGEAAVRSKMGSAVAGDAFRLNPLCVAVIVVFLYIAFRNLAGIVLPLTVVGWSTVVMLGLMAYAGSPVYIITNAILVTVVSLGVADSIHILGEYYRARELDGAASSRDLVARVNVRLWAPVFYTSVTDMVGFASLCLTGLMPPLERFGLFAALGCGASLIASQSLLPAAIALLDPVLRRHKRRRDWAGEGRLQKILAGLGEAIRRNPRKVALACAAVVAAGAALATRVRVDQSMVSAFDEEDEIVQSDRKVNRLFHGTYFLDVVIDGGRPGALAEPELLRRIHALEETAKRLEHVKGSISVAGFARKLNQILHDWEPSELRIPEDVATVREHFSLLDASPSKKADFLRTVDPPLQTANVRLRLSTGRYVDERVVVEAMDRHIAELFPAGGPVKASLAGRVNMDYHWVRLIVRSNVWNVACSMTIVFLLLMPLFRSLTAGFLCVVPVASAIACTYALMVLVGIDLGIGTSMFASLATGVGVNFPIHVLTRLRRAMGPEALGEQAAFAEMFRLTGKALLFNAMSVCFGFLALLVSDLPLLRHFGLMISAGIGTACIASLTLLPALVAWLKPRVVYGPRRPEGA